MLKSFSECYQIILALLPLPAPAFSLLDSWKKSWGYRFLPDNRFPLLCLGFGGIHSFLSILCSLQGIAFQTFSLCYRKANIHQPSRIIYFSYSIHSNHPISAANKEFDVLLVFMFDSLGCKEDETPFVVDWKGL